MYRLVLFDIDKTLLVGSTIHYTALKNALSEVYGIANPAPVKNMQGMTDLKIICEILTQENMDLESIKLGLDKCMHIMYLKYKDALQEQDLKVLEGVKQLLENLQRVGIPTGLVTGNTEAIAWLKLEKVGLSKYFQFGGFGDKIVKRSDLVKNAIKFSEQTFGKLNNRNIFLIGDTPRDIVGGQKVGVNTIGVATGDFSVEELAQAGADFIVKDLKDSEKILNIILNSK
jgi:phosphoglycolate phosphatase